LVLAALSLAGCGPSDEERLIELRTQEASIMADSMMLRDSLEQAFMSGSDLGASFNPVFDSLVVLNARLDTVRARIDLLLR
jgi:hypothetical protein